MNNVNAQQQDRPPQPSSLANSTNAQLALIAKAHAALNDKHAAVKPNTVTAQPQPVAAAAKGQPQVPTSIVPTVKGATPAYASEEEAPDTTRATSIGPPPGQYSSVLNRVASLALQYSSPVDPGQVSTQQQAVLNAWQANAQSDYSQFMFDQGMTAVATNPSALFSEEEGATQAVWSQQDLKASMDALQLSGKDFDEWQKLEAKKKSGILKKIEGVVEIVVGVIIDYYTAGLGGNGLIAAGAANL